MRITKISELHADGGWRVFSFLKVETDEGVTGWSEFGETGWSRGLAGVLRRLSEGVIGRDPRAVGRLTGELRAASRMTSGGLMGQAIAAIENACLDIKAKALGVPVYALFGGPYRDRLRLYWSHCGSFRGRSHEFFEKVLGTPPLRSLDDIRDLGAEAVRRGYSAIKTNPLDFSGERPRMLNSGFQIADLDFAGNWDSRTIGLITDQIAAFRDGLGPGPGIMLDTNFAFRTEGYLRVAKALEPLGVTWLELDIHDPPALGLIRRSTTTPIASLEAIYGTRNYRPYFENQAVDVAIIDVVWNGLLESVRIANLADSFEVNVAPHNFYSHLADCMSAHLSAAVPNFRIMEYEGDDVPWKADLVTPAPVVKDGMFHVPSGPGWGVEINEEAVRAHPAPTPA